MLSPAQKASREQRVLTYIAGYCEAHGSMPPSWQEIADACGLHRRASVGPILDQLEQQGHIRRLPMRKRAIALCHPVAIPRAPATGEPLYFIQPSCGAEKREDAA
ncbi:hypothetical protein D6851_02435 [Altericroceibacterium spongiae]|uniref:LexA repressor DNA-binding domain-containing protein n=1 Tax=Altericroceibacterium spongiae TaxID=2320269 RepID=A0A420ERP1_9SPHN|nr:hypothetical protein [Altericroceibacterium spongiae]RKF23349.1 hypothetical protein D6851_02435 [Altericroceibacterium spongiae]